MRIHGRLLVRNAALTLLGQIIPAVVALVTIPSLIRGLGGERFGVLALTWTVLGYFTVFDLIGRATTRFVADCLGRNDLEEVPRIIWTALTVQCSIGLAGGLALAATVPMLTTRILNLSTSVIPEAQGTLYALAAALPFVICSRNLRGILEARQRFDLVAFVQVPTTLLVSLLPFMGMKFGFSLPSIMLAIVTVWLTNSLTYVAVAFSLFPGLSNFKIDRKFVRPLLSYGGWIVICNVLIAVLGSFDRFVIGSALAVKILPYYTAPADMTFRLMIIPSVLGMTVFPAFTTLLVTDRAALERLYWRSVTYVLLLVGPIVAVAALFASDILSVWLGGEFVLKSTAVFQVLLVGMFLTALGQMPANLLDGVGRPDLRAKTFLLYGPFYLALSFFLTTRIGILGTAMAFSIKAALETVVFFAQSWRVIGHQVDGLVRGMLAKTILGLVVLLLLEALLKKATGGVWVHALSSVGCIAVFAVCTWLYILDGVDRRSLSGALRRINYGV